MGNEKRTADWIDKFLNYVGEKHPDLVIHFFGKIIFSPQMGNPLKILASYVALDDTKEFKEIRERMFLVFEDYYRENPV